MRCWKLSPFPALALLLLALPAARAQDNPTYINVHAPLTSTTMVVVPLGKGMASQGSGFVVDRENRLMVTNKHVVMDKDDVDVIFPVYEADHVRTDRAYYLKKARPVRGKVLDRDQGHDLALVQLESLPNEAVELKLADKSPEPGDKIHASGNPGSDTRAFVYTTGKVRESKPQELIYQDKTKVNAQVLEVDTDHQLEPGVSGGPLVNANYELIGVVSATPAERLRALCIEVREVRRFLGDAMRRRATEAIRKKQYDQAVAACTTALKFNPLDALAYNERGAAHSFRDDYDKAIADYTAALEIDGSLARAWRNRGSMYFHKGKYEQAVADCSEAIRIHPEYAQAFLTRSKALAKLNRDDRARSDRATALRLDPSLK